VRYVGVFVAGFVLALLAAPLWREALMAHFQADYGALTYRCDSAMREHYIARARLADAPDAQLADDLQAAEIALIDCQDYDILQKRLIQFGLRENELALMRLRAIEGPNGRLDEVVRIHEIRD
jgi:hypothetical protein